MTNVRPSVEAWLDEIKGAPGSPAIGMFLIHNGVVRAVTRDGSAVSGLYLSYDRRRLDEVIAQVEGMPGVVAARAWINEGTLNVGDDMIYALVAGDVRPNVFGGWRTLVRLIKSDVVTQREILEPRVESK